DAVDATVRPEIEDDELAAQVLQPDGGSGVEPAGASFQLRGGIAFEFLEFLVVRCGDGFEAPDWRRRSGDEPPCAGREQQRRGEQPEGSGRETGNRRGGSR